MMYNDNICCHMYKRNNYYHYISSYNNKHVFMYKRSVCCHYTSSCIMRNTLSCIIKIFVVIIYLLI